MKKTVTIRVIDGEYQVPGRTSREAETYYTDDKRDAIETAHAIHGGTVNLKFRKIEE